MKSILLKKPYEILADICYIGWYAYRTHLK